MSAKSEKFLALIAKGKKKKKGAGPSKEATEKIMNLKK